MVKWVILVVVLLAVFVLLIGYSRHGAVLAYPEASQHLVVRLRGFWRGM